MDALKALEGRLEEGNGDIAEVEGAIPSGLRGTFVRNGPGLNRMGSDEVAFLDGHGLVAGVSFENGQAWYRARLVQTAMLAAEKMQNRMVTRRLFTNLPGRWKNFFNIKFGNPAGHDVFSWGGRLIAAETFGYYHLNPETLDTVGAETLGGAIQGDVKAGPMPRPDGVSDRLILYTMQPGKLGPDVVTFREFDREWRQQHEVRYVLPGPGTALHDLAFTEHYYVVIQLGTLSAGQALGGRHRLWDAIHCDPATTPRAFLVPRREGKPLIVPFPNQVSFHIFNAFERGRELVFDTSVYTRKPDFSATYSEALRQRMGLALHATPPPQITRHVVNLDNGTVRSTPLENAIGDAPDVDGRRHGQPHRFGYAAARCGRGDEVDDGSFIYFHGIGKADFEAGTWETWGPGPRAFCTPPSFVPRAPDAEEDDGWLLTWILDAAADRTDVAILDARKLTDGPVARLHLPLRLPAASHCRFEADMLLRKG